MVNINYSRLLKYEYEKGLYDEPTRTTRGGSKKRKDREESSSDRSARPTKRATIEESRLAPPDVSKIDLTIVDDSSQWVPAVGRPLPPTSSCPR
jgi:hypothetical protein